MRTLTTKNYKYGLITNIENDTIPRGAASSSLNWLTKGDHIELRPGQRYMGTSSVNSGNGRATGLKKVIRANKDAGEVLFGAYGKKLKYYDETTSEWVEVGSDLLGNDVVDTNGYGKELISMSTYTGLAGNQIFVNSTNSAGFFKIFAANPGSSLNVYNSAKNFKGNIKIDTNRTLLTATKTDATGVYGSYIDNQIYTTVTAEAYGTGDGSTKTFAHTAAAISGTRTIFGVQVTDGVESFTDDFDGVLTGSLGGTGTVNYVTGAISVTFNTAPANLAAITTTYQWEDSNNKGITDFTKSSTRLAGEGFIFRQDEGGGPIQGIGQYNQIYYCMHLKKTWVLNITTDDTNATNLPYRQRVGIPNTTAYVETGDGIYYVDDTDKSDVKIRLLTYELGGSNQVVPIAKSNNVNLNAYRFDKSCGFQYGDFVLFTCATNESVQQINGEIVALNNRVIVYNKLWKSIDILDYSVTCFEEYNGTLIGGDALSNNFIELFSGFDDFDADAIENYWIGGNDDLDIEELKKTKKFQLRGLIQVDQKLKVSVAVDGGAFVEIGSSDDSDGNHTYAIEGTGSYIDTGNAVYIGGPTLGTRMIGGGSTGNFAYSYEREFKIQLDKFERILIKYEAVGVGYVSVSQQRYVDIRKKAKKPPAKYRG